MRTANPPEDRILRAFRQANIITADQQRAARDLLEATEPCGVCIGAIGVIVPTCPRCDGTGEQRVIR